MKLLRLRESDINGNLGHRTVVKRESMKCWNSLSSVNFLWTWIYKGCVELEGFWPFLPLLDVNHKRFWQSNYFRPLGPLTKCISFTIASQSVSLLAENEGCYDLLLLKCFFAFAFQSKWILQFSKSLDLKLLKDL